MDLAPYIEHTRLRADTTPADVDALCREAVQHRFGGVCVNPLFVPHAKRAVSGSAVRVVTVAGFPLGASHTSIRVAEARRAVEEGADDVDLVLPVGPALASDWTYVEDDVRAVREAIPRATLKVILETGHFDEAGITRATEICVLAGADFVKTSTGFGPRGASVRDVELMIVAAGGRARVKASGGIKTAREAIELISAGATRLGTSSGVSILLGAAISGR
ncbi:MAG TPA: deoxyribose-phosphate aldolase [Polyangiaceae bacterium]|nr:deoxyribose-phosphate aldolase [Polyangiaceae bacterium]